MHREKIFPRKFFPSAGKFSATPVRQLIRRRLGDLVLRLLLFKAQSHAAREVRLSSPEETQGFFARLGFRPVSRETRMVQMMLPGDEISLDSCANCKKQNCPNRN